MNPIVNHVENSFDYVIFDSVLSIRFYFVTFRRSNFCLVYYNKRSKIQKLTM